MPLASAAKPQNIERERIAFLDGLRGFAVLAVVAFHSSRHLSNITASAPLVATLLQQMCHGVDLFFVLSGFCLAYPTLRKFRIGGNTNFDLAAYGAHRIVRIVPPYYAAITLLIITAFLASLNPTTASLMPQVSAKDIVRQALFIDANVHLLNISFWSLAVEFRWYFLFPVFLWFWVRSPRAFLVAAMGICLAALLTRAQSLDLLFLPTFLLGIVAAGAFTLKRNVRSWFAWFLLFSVLAFLKSRNDGWMWNTNPLWGIAMFWLVMGVSGARYVKAAFSHPLLTKIGFASYAIYLTHEPLITFLSARVGFIKNQWALFGVLVLASVAFGAAFSYVAERPFVQGRLRFKLIHSLNRLFVYLLEKVHLTPSMSLPSPPVERPRASAA